MNCAEIKSKLLPFYYSELSAIELEVIRAHLALCGHCTQEHHTIIGVLKCIADSLVEEPVPASLHERLVLKLGGGELA